MTTNKKITMSKYETIAQYLLYWAEYFNEDKANLFREAAALLRQQGQGAAQGQEWVDELIEFEKEKFGSNYFYHGTSYQATDWINQNVVAPLQSQIAALQEEIKRLREIEDATRIPFT